MIDWRPPTWSVRRACSTTIRASRSRPTGCGPSARRRGSGDPRRAISDALLAHNTVNGAALVRRTAFEAVGGFDESMREGLEDWDLWLRIVAGGQRGVIVPEVLYHYRRHAGSMSHGFGRAANEAYLRPYRALVAKHADLFRPRLSAMTIAAERSIADLRQHVHDLELEWTEWLEPERRGLADDVAQLERRTGAPRRHVGGGCRLPASRRRATRRRGRGPGPAAVVELAHHGAFEECLRLVARGAGRPPGMSRTLATIIRCSDASRHVWETARSAERQTRAAAAIVVVTDESTPLRARDWVNRTCESRGWRNVHASDAHPGAAWNAGVEAVATDLVTCVDAGDRLAADHNVAVVEAVAAAADLVVTAVLRRGPGTSSGEVVPPPPVDPASLWTTFVASRHPWTISRRAVAVARWLRPQSSYARGPRVRAAGHPRRRPGFDRGGATRRATSSPRRALSPRLGDRGPCGGGVAPPRGPRGGIRFGGRRRDRRGPPSAGGPGRDERCAARAPADGGGRHRPPAKPRRRPAPEPAGRRPDARPGRPVADVPGIAQLGLRAWGRRSIGATSRRSCSATATTSAARCSKCRNRTTPGVSAAIA